MKSFPRRLTTPALLLAAALAACSGDGAGLTGPDGLADHTTDPCGHDVLAPTISSVSATPNVLWPPNHKMVPVTVAVSASDACSDVASRIVGVTSDEPVDGLGDGHTAPDWIVTGDLTLLVRSERSGTGDGRVYTVTIDATDESGNVSTAATTILVPHDQGK